MANLNRNSRWLTVLVTLALAAPLTGCALRAAEHLVQDDEAEVRQVIRDYYAAIVAGDSKAACSKLTGQLQRDLIYLTAGDDPYPPTCSQLVRYSSNVLGPDEKAGLRSIGLNQYDLTVRGTRAILRMPDGSKAMVLTKAPDVGWLIAVMYGPDSQER